jgi:hypothetical protein
LRTYLASFDARIIGLTGSEAQIAEAAQGWNAYYNKFTESDGSITIVHSAHVYLMDADNRLAATLNFQEPEAEQLAKLKVPVGRQARKLNAAAELIRRSQRTRHLLQRLAFSAMPHRIITMDAAIIRTAPSA